MASSRGEPLLFRGFPRSVEGFVPIPHEELLTVRREAVVGGVGKSAEQIAVQSVPHGRHTQIRLVLPEMTPPGEYPGTLRLGERTFDIVLRVDGAADLASVPACIDLVNGAGKPRETLTLVNRGNTVTTIESKYRFGLFAETGLDRAIGRAFGTEAKDGQSHLDVLVSAAADEYGGIATATVAEGAGPIEPGQMRGVTFAFRFSQKARSGASYFGYLPVANLTIPVRVHTEQHDTGTEVPA